MSDILKHVSSPSVLGKRIVGALLACVCLTPMLWSQSLQLVPTVNRVAGQQTDGYAGDGGPATSANLEGPTGTVHDAAGNMYIADRGNHCIREVAYGTGIITTIAGTGTAGFSGDGGSAISAQLNDPSAVALDTSGNLYISDTLNNRIREVNLASGNITTLVGTGVAGYSGDGGAPAAAQLNGPIGMVLDSAGNLYIADYNNSSVRKVSADQSVITTAVGNGVAGFSGDGGPAANAQLSQANLLAIDTAGDLYIADYGNARVRTVDHTSGKIATVAGDGSPASSGDGGAATAAALQPTGIAIDNAGNLLIVDTIAQVVRLVSAASGVIDTVAGTGAQDYTGDGGPATQAAFHDPVGIEFNNGTTYIADAGNNMIRTLAKVPPLLPAAQVGSSASTNIYFQVVDAPLSISSIAFAPSQGTSDFYATVQGCTVDGTTQNAVGTICVTQVSFTPAYPGLRSWPLVVVTSAGTQNIGVSGPGQGSQVVLGPGTITSIAGTGTAGYSGDKSAATAATLKAPQKTVLDSMGNTYIADTANNVIREIAAGTGTITTLAGSGAACSSAASACGDGGAATSADLNGPNGVAIDSAGNLYIADTLDHRIREVNAVTGVITTIAGTGAPAYTGDGALATAATLNSPSDVALDTAGNIYIADTANNAIREINLSSGSITTVAGGSTPCDAGTSPCGDGGTAITANLNQPAGIAIDPSGDIYIADTLDHRVREVDAFIGYIFTVAGSGNAGYSGDGSSATLANLSAPSDITLDSAGNIYIADTGNNVVRMVELQSGAIITIVGTNATACAASTAVCGDAGPSTGANLNAPSGIALDGPGNLYVSDTSDNRVREINGASLSLTFASTALGATSSDSPQTVTLYSTGTSALNFPAVNAGTDPVISAGFTLAGSSTCPQFDTSSSGAQLQSGDACTYAVNFVPTTAGAIAGTLAITDDSLNAMPPGYATQTINLNGSGSTSTTLTSSNTAPNYGQSVTFTVTVAAATSAPATGTASFYSGSTLLSTVTLDASGSATLATKALPAGTDAVNVVYSGDSNNAQATSNTVTETVSQSSGMETLTTSNASPAFGQSITLTDTIPTSNGTPPTGTVNFYAGSTRLGAGTVDGTGVATLATAALPGGTSSVVAFYGGDSNYSFVISNSVTETVAKASGADTLTTSNASPAFGASITLTDTIPTVNSVAPTGTVTFSNGTTAIGTGTVNTSGVATLTISTLPAGTDSITAVYGGDGNYASVTAGPLAETVAKSTATGTLTTSNASPAFGQSITLTDSLATAGSVAPTGTVTFSNGTTVIGTGAVNASGIATLTTAALPAGTDSVTAAYAGDGNYSSATAGPLTETVGKAAANSTLTTSDASPVSGEFITLTDTITVVNGAAPNGTVTFYNGTAILGTGAVNSLGAASFTTNSLPAGANSITAVYPGDNNYPGSTAGPIVENVSKSTVPDTLTSSNASISLGQSVTFTDTIPVVNGAAPNGTVTFYAATTMIGTGTLNGSGQATVTTSSLPAGSILITAVYPGDNNYQSANAGPFTETVAKSSAADTLTASNLAPTVGASVTFTDTIPAVMGFAPTGMVTFYNGSAALGTGTVSASGVATLATSALPAGGNSITGVYSGDANYATVTAGPVTVTVAKAGGTDVLTSSNQAPTVGQSVTFTDTLPTLNGVVATGTVTFNNGATVIGTGTVNSSGIATFMTGSLAVGMDSITAVYGGDANYSSSTAGPLVETVAKTSATAALTSSNQSPAVAQSVTFTDTLTVANGMTPTGTVTFYNGTTAIGTGTVNALSLATLTTASLPSGTDSITAVYGGDGNYNTATAGPLVETVGTAVGKTVAPSVITSSDLAPVFGASVTLTDTMAGANGVAPTGTVTFYYGTTAIGTGTLSASGVATLTTASLPVGSDVITAVYGGDATYESSTAGPITEVVTMPAVQTTVATLTASTNAITFGQSVTFTSAVTLAGAVAPTGTVSFSDGTTAIGTGVMDATGMATLSTTTLAVGSHSITVSYAGDANYGPATAGPVTVTVSAAAATADFTISATSTNTTVLPGGAVSYTVSLAGLHAAFSLPVTLSATGMPAGAVVSFKPASVVPGAGPTTTTMTVQTAATQSSLSPLGSLPRIAYGLLLLPLLGVRRFRRKLHAIAYVFALLAALAAFGGMTGCAGGSIALAPQQYTITVTGSSNALQHSTKVILTVQ